MVQSPFKSWHCLIKTKLSQSMYFELTLFLAKSCCISPSVSISRDFAYVARDPSTGKHKCHMFRCHGNISGRAITNALHDMCSKILEEKKKAQESSRKTSIQKPWSDIINTPPPPSARGMKTDNLKKRVIFN